jgi:hypothetical protein
MESRTFSAKPNDSFENLTATPKVFLYTSKKANGDLIIPPQKQQLKLLEKWIKNDNGKVLK